MPGRGIGKTRTRKKKKLRYKHKVAGSGSCPRLVVFRSNKHIYAQLIDDENNKTMMTGSTISGIIRDQLEGKTKSEQAEVVGKSIGEKAAEAGIRNIRFDRNGYLYHGRIKALADGARAAGLKF